MWICYLIAIVPLAVGLVLWLASKKITIGEWALSFGVGIILTLIVHAISVAGMTSDVETWSGQINRARFSPKWVEEYQVAIYKTVTKTRTVGSGKDRRTETYTESVFSHWETRHRTHPDEWDATDTLGQGFDINRQTYEDIKANFGGKQETKMGLKSGFDSGSPETYFAHNQTGYVYPTTTTKHWTNRVKACPSVFSFAKVPENVPVMEYPPPADGWRPSNRLLGSASAVPIREWDQLNSRLGPTKKVNLIACGLGQDSMLGQWQEAKWVGGKKNDLVITFGGDPKKPDWVHVFGWSESFQIKSVIEGLVSEKGFVPEVLPLIEKEMTGYQIKDWSKFDYLTIEPPTWAYVVQVIVMILTQGGVWAWAWFNEFEKKPA